MRCKHLRRALDYNASAPAAPAGLQMDLQNSGARIGDRKRAAHDDDDEVDPKYPKLQSFNNRDGVDKGPSRASSLGSSHGSSAIGGTNSETLVPFSRTRTVPRFFIPCARWRRVCGCVGVLGVCACMQDRERHRERARASEGESET